MEIGNQIKSLRIRKGVTQESMAQHFGISPQAVSKWERNAAAPDIAMLPQLSAYFGVSIDELFAISDDTRMERIQNMLWDVRYLNPADVQNERQFLLAKAEREPQNGRPLELLADMENHLAREHQSKAAEYAKEALLRDPTLIEAHGELVDGMRGFNCVWYNTSKTALIEFYKDYIDKYPDCKNAYLHLMDQLIADCRMDEAKEYLDRFAAMDDTHRVLLYHGMIQWHSGNWDAAFAIFDRMTREHPDRWGAHIHIGDYLARSGRLRESLPYFRKALDVQTAPRYCDPIESIAQVYELLGDIPAAIAAWQEELELLEKEWNTTTGETADAVRRQITRLKALNTNP